MVGNHHNANVSPSLVSPSMLTLSSTQSSSSEFYWSCIYRRRHKHIYEYEYKSIYIHPYIFIILIQKNIRGRFWLLVVRLRRWVVFCQSTLAFMIKRMLVYRQYSYIPWTSVSEGTNCCREEIFLRWFKSKGE